MPHPIPAGCEAAPARGPTLSPNPEAATPQPATGRGWIARAKRIDRLFLATVVVPTLLAAIYFGLIASDIYVSESRFMVRSPSRPLQAGALGSLLQGSGLSRNLDDQHSVHDYILSRDALKELNDEMGLDKKFGDRRIDLVNRFAALDWDDSFEGLLKYYHRRVSASLDSKSSISVLRVSAFSAEDAKKINERLLAMSERLVNEMSERSRQDIVRFAQNEVKLAEKKAKDAALAVAAFRSDKSVVDPEKQSAFQLQQLGKLQEELIATKTQIAQLRSISPDNSQIASLLIRQSSLQKEVDAELARIAGRGGSLTSKAAGYMQVALEREFAEKQLATAMSLLETARNEAQRQQLYLDRVVQPNLPDYPIEPRRIRYTLIVLALGLVSWTILSLLIAAVREHLD
jgi:capsular polysaccharide transport system permease protein